MNARPEELVEHIVSEMAVEPLVLYRDHAEMETYETTIKTLDYGRPARVPAIAVTVSIPRTGNEDLWKLTPDQFQLRSPQGRIESARGSEAGKLHIHRSERADDPSEQIKRLLDEEIKFIRFCVDSRRRQIELAQ